jgi:hypothetical protein
MGGVMGGLNGFIEITQDDDAMRVDGPLGIIDKALYRFDGTEVRYTFYRNPVDKTGKRQGVYKSRWSGSRLVTTTIAGERSGWTETRYMEGNEMVEFVRVAPGGGWWKTYYKRVE